MRNISRLIVIVFLCLLIAGCYETFSPIQSGNITYWKNGRPQDADQQLTTEQVTNLSAWLQNHRWGWQPVIATYSPKINIYIVHSNGTKSSANLMQKILIVGQYQRSISETERQELLSIMGIQNGD